MHYVDEGGAGRPILFCHGNPTWSFLYRNVIIRLRRHFRCIAVDYLGFGLSERPEAYGYTIEEHARCVGELVEYLQLDGFITMGQDWGGPVSIAVGTARAERVLGVILGNTWFWPVDQLATKLVSRVMSTAWMQRQILLRPVRSPWFQRVEWNTAPVKQARPGSPGTDGSAMGSLASMSTPAVSGPALVSIRQRCAASSQAASSRLQPKRMRDSSPCSRATRRR